VKPRVRLLLLALAAALAFAGWWRWGAHPARVAPAGPGADSVQAGLHPVQLWFADPAGDSLVVEVRSLPVAEGLHERASQLVDALDQGPLRRGVAVVPTGTALEHAYLDEHGTLTLDLSRAFTQGFHGGSREEDLVVSSLVRTLGANLPEARRVLVTCAGSPIGSLGGHLPLDRPIDLHTAF
jgi:hypothetical protein